ncbi:MAG: aldo/keto reductase [Spirochaetia bacterium]
MKNRIQLGNTGFSISTIGLGCWQFFNGKGFVGRYWSPLSDEVEDKTIKVSLERGVNWFDTVQAYGWGVSEQALGKHAKKYERDYEFLIADKWFTLSSHELREIDIVSQNAS